MLLRKWLANLSRVFFLALVFVIVLGGSALVIAVTLSWFREVPISDVANLYSGLICGLIAWLFVAAFHLRRETICLPFQDPHPVMKQVQAVLTELGYERHDESSPGQWYKPSFRSYLLGGRVRLSIEDSNVIVTGPKFCLELLRRWLRIRSHLDNVQQAIQESRRRQGERLLSRVQLAIRVPPRLWPEIAQQVIKPLEREAEVVCQLNILAHNDAGIRDNVIEFQIRSWLTSQGITAEVHKDLMMRDEAPRHEAVRVLTDGVPA